MLRWVANANAELYRYELYRYELYMYEHYTQLVLQKLCIFFLLWMFLVMNVIFSQNNATITCVHGVRMGFHEHSDHVHELPCSNQPIRLKIPLNIYEGYCWPKKNPIAIYNKPNKYIGKVLFKDTVTFRRHVRSRRVYCHSINESS